MKLLRDVATETALDQELASNEKVPDTSVFNLMSDHEIVWTNMLHERR